MPTLFEMDAGESCKIDRGDGMQQRGAIMIGLGVVRHVGSTRSEARPRGIRRSRR